MRFWQLLLPLLASAQCLAVQPDRITGPIDTSQRIALQGNVHGFAQPRFDVGRADGNKLISGVTLAFRLSAAQQADLDNLLVQQQDRSSANFHRWLTPVQFANRFGMTPRDISRVAEWLESQGFSVSAIANSRNQISFNGSVAQIESVFGTEIHNYLVDGEIHFANATNPSVPAALASLVVGMGNLHDFRPKPHLVRPHFTSSVSGDHFLTPGDFATIYDIQPLYNAGIDGSGQTIAVVGQTAIFTSDINNFRAAAGLPAKLPSQVLVPFSGNSVVSTGDLGEADLDLEWSNGVAKNATVIYVYVGNNPNYSVWNSLQYAIDNNLAPVISISYGACETANGKAFADQVQGWVLQANLQGQTVVASSGDSGAADCDGQVASATGGLAVDVPAAIPEVTGMGGTEFFGDPASTTTTTYWQGASGGDTISSALQYIPEEAWNDTTQNATLSASGGGASLYFAKPAWQSGTGVPNDGQRDVPDLAFSSSPDHDGYLICSQNDSDGLPSCTSGFRDSKAFLDVIGGTSAATPSFAGVLALLNQYLVTNGFLTKAGIGIANPNLYHIATYNPTAMNDVTTGNNIVPCTTGTPNCPAKAPLQYGFTAGVGYDQVTGLGSVNANSLAIAWGELMTTSTTSVTPSSAAILGGSNETLTATVTPSSATGIVSFYNNGSTTAIGTASVSSGTGVFSTTSLPNGTNAITASYTGSHANSQSPAATVTVTPPFTMSAFPATLSLPAGQSAVSQITITPAAGFTQSVNFTNSTASSPGSCIAGLPAGALCSFNPTVVSPLTSPTTVLTITTTANMALPSGAQPITILGVNGNANNTTNVSLTVTATNQTFALSTTAKTFPIAVGGTATVPITVTGTNNFVNSSNSTTALPLTYTCSGIPAAAEIACQVSPGNGQPTNAAAVTINLVTTPVTTGSLRPGKRGGPGGLLYALLLPSIFGIVFAARSRTGNVRLLGVMLALGLSTVGMVGCGGGNNNNNSLKNAGTPPGNYAITINGTTGGTNPLTGSAAITLNVQ